MDMLELRLPSVIASRRLWALGLSLLCTGLIAAGNATAAWASHGIINEANSSVRYPISVRQSDDKKKVRIFLPAGAETQLGHCLIVAKKRLPREELEFRMSMNRWKRYAEFLAEGIDYRSGRGLNDWSEFYADVDRFEEMKLLKPESRDGVRGIFLELDKDTALRAYIVYDFLPWGGSGIRDGGLWLTYDVPSIVEALSASQGEKKATREGKGLFRVKDVVIRKGGEGSMSFHVCVEKLSAERPKGAGTGIRLRIWEKTAAGDLVVVDPESPPEWDMMSVPWKGAGSNDLVLDWTGPKPGSGNVYYGFSVDVFSNDKIQDSWSNSPDLLTHLLAVEPLESSKFGYRSRPVRIYFEARKKLAEIRKNARPESRAADVEEVRRIAEILTALVEKYPDEQPSSFMRSDLREAQRFLAEQKKE